MNLGLLLHFLKFDIRTESLEIGDWIRRLYTSNDLTDRFPEKRTSLELCVERIGSASTLPVRQPPGAAFAETNLCGAPCFYANGKFFSAMDGEYPHEMEYDLDTHVIRANVGGKYLANAQSVVSNVVRAILQSFVLPFYGIKSLHGAVLTKEKRTVLLAGQGGMGKSTTAIQLLRSGYEILSDDGPFFTTHEGNARALTSLDYVHLTGNTLALFPELEKRVVGGKDNREKFAARISDLQSGSQWRQPLPVTHYVQLRRTAHAATPRVEKLDRNAVHRNLLDESMVIFRHPRFRTAAYPFAAYSAFVFDLVTTVVQGSETFAIEFADQHLAQIPALIDQL